MVSKRNFTDDEKQLIIQLYQSGETLASIKKRLHCAFKTIKDFLSDNNIETRCLASPKKRIFTQQEQELIMEMCKNGSTTDEICMALNCSEKVLTRFFRENNFRKEKVKRGPSRLTHNEFLRQLQSVSTDIVPIDNYIKRDAPIYFQCIQCGHKWLARPGNILAGHKCPSCNGKMPYTQESFVEKMKQVNKDIEVIGVYGGTRSRIRCRCKICDAIWNPLASALLCGKGCPTCKESYGERQIRSYLEMHNIKFVSQYKFDDCRRLRPLPFDFYLPDFNTVIEYDGQQHFGEIEVFGGQDRFLYTKENDNIKTTYCEQNSIKLIRIPYWEVDNISQILSSFVYNSK
jgi:very-short-patch-repair endonuclease/transposase-like protein